MVTCWLEREQEENEKDEQEGQQEQEEQDERQCRMRSTGVLRVLGTQYVLEWDVIEKKDSTEHWC